MKIYRYNNTYLLEKLKCLVDINKKNFKATNHNKLKLYTIIK
jgi:hypothetical protein